VTSACGAAAREDATFFNKMCINNERVRKDCALSCGLCNADGSTDGDNDDGPTIDPLDPNCKDEVDDCAVFVKAGWCDYEVRLGTPGTISKNCRRSCGFCNRK